MLLYFLDKTEHDKEIDQQLGDLDNKIADLESENEALKEERTLLKERVRVGNSVCDNLNTRKAFGFLVSTYKEFSIKSFIMYLGNCSLMFVLVKTFNRSSYFTLSRKVLSYCMDLSLYFKLSRNVL